MMLLAKSDMSIGDALLLSVIGFVLVMAVLCLLMGIIYLMSYLIAKSNGKTMNLKDFFNKILKRQGTAEETAVVAESNLGAEAPAVVSAALPTAKLAKGSAGEVKIGEIEPATAAIIMAIVADTLKTPINELRFISIKEL